MRKITITAICFLLFTHIDAQVDMPVQEVPVEIFRTVKKDPNDTTGWQWKRSGLFNLNIAQGSLSNWAAGGENFSLAIVSYFNYYLLNRGVRHTWDNNFDFNFGYLKTTSQGGRKNDDRIDVLSKYGYKLDTTKKIYLSGLFNLRTQLFNGYGYIGDSAYLSSSFISPMYLVLAVGFDFKPVTNFSLFLSPLTNRTTIIANKTLSAKGAYGVAAGKHVLNQIGAFASVNYSANIIKNVSYKGRLDLFTDYQNNPSNVDLYYTNYLNFQINKYMTATYGLDMIYDDDVKLFGKNNDSPALQVKSLIGIGVSIPFEQVKK
ncbi:MAG: DUF3078 domain-containing protein [Bacteroidetes bacterium]|nr:DUF3078 domain-containing protein [Bacteroidota bacterium]